MKPVQQSNDVIEIALLCLFPPFNEGKLFETQSCIGMAGNKCPRNSSRAPSPSTAPASASATPEPQEVVANKRPKISEQRAKFSLKYETDKKSNNEVLGSSDFPSYLMCDYLAVV
jgi:hypothetical protein